MNQIMLDRPTLSEERVLDNRRRLNLELIGRPFELSDDKTRAFLRRESPNKSSVPSSTRSYPVHVTRQCKRVQLRTRSDEQLRKILNREVDDVFDNIIFEVEVSHLQSILNTTTTRLYTGGTSRETVDRSIDQTFLHRLKQELRRNNIPMVTKVRGSGSVNNYIEIPPCYLVFVHHYLESDITDVSEFRHVTTLLNDSQTEFTRISACEFGSWNQLRFLSLNNFGYYLGSVQDDYSVAHQLERNERNQVKIFPMIAVGQYPWSSLPIKDTDTDLLHIEAIRSFMSTILKFTFYSCLVVDDPSQVIIAEAGASVLAD